MNLSSTIFRAYDIRGTYPDQLNTENALLIGRGFASYLIKKKGLKKPRVVVGRDNRTHGTDLQDFFIQGLMMSGCEVVNIGLSPSPYVYFSNTYESFDAGCNVTASHNPKDYNGFKLMLSNAHAVCGEELQVIYKIIESEDFVDGKGHLSYANYMDDYFKKLKSIFKFGRPLKVVIDTGNGIGGLMYPLFLKKMGHEVIELYTDLDGNFPNHEPDPIVESNLEELKKLVVDQQADIGLAFDGDGDRVGIVTEGGDFINADQLLLLLSSDVLSRHPNGTLVFTVSNSQLLFDQVEKWGGQPVMCKVGHSYVENAMTENDAILGGEQSGHFFLPEDYYPYDDALATACRILSILSSSDQSMSSYFNAYPKVYAEPEYRPFCDDDHKFSIVQSISDYFSSRYDCNTLDGVRINFENGAWSGIRASNTSPCLSITMEAKSEERLSEIKQIVFSHLKDYNEISLDSIEI